MHAWGKGERPVPMLLSKETETAIQLLNDTRERVGLSPENVLVFAAPTRKSKKALRGSKCLSTVLGRIPSLQRPDLINSTPLRYLNYYRFVVKPICLPSHKKVKINTKYIIYRKFPVMKHTRI